MAVQPRSEAPTGSSGAYLARQACRESNARAYPRRIPLAIERAQGLYLTTVDGTTYIDCLAGAGALALGHNHPVVVGAIRATLDHGAPLQVLDLATPIKDEFVEELFRVLPEELATRGRIQFCSPAGTDAVEAALKLVKTATGRRTVLTFQGAYHGMTAGAHGVTDGVAVRRELAGLTNDVQFLPYPYPYRCPFGLGGEASHRVSSRYLERLLNHSEGSAASVAGVLLEVVQGEGGVVPAPDEWLAEVRRITGEQGIPLIVDEVQTGVGRTGRMFAFEHAGVVPDVLVLSKALGGSLPLAVIVYRAELDCWGPGDHAGTFRGNQLAMATGTATLSYVVTEDLPTRAAQMGERLTRALRETQRDTDSIGEVRGRGLMVGVEIVDPGQSPDRVGARPAQPALARCVQAECLRRGLITELGGRHGSVVRFLPPLIVTADEIDAIAERFDGAVRAAERSPSRLDGEGGG